jgi:mannose-6-phosphate isomerase-like protein (cupin superfamily)
MRDSGAELDVLKNLKVQSFTWGNFRWIYEPSDITSNHPAIGMTTIYPGETHSSHYHFGVEQIIYIVSGQGVHWVNDVEQSLFSDRAYTIPTGAKHVIMNTGNKPLKMITVNLPFKIDTIIEDVVDNS